MSALCWEEKLDEFGELDRQMQLIAPPRYRSLRKEILAEYENSPAGQAIEAHGRHYVIRLSPRARERKIFDKLKAFQLLRKAIGLEVLTGLITIPLRDAIDKHGLFLAWEQTGDRELTTVLRVPAASEVKAA
jgi:hypothetical protein